jgi:TPR repeat protein
MELNYRKLRVFKLKYLSKKSLSVWIVAAFVTALTSTPILAYPIVSNECKSDPVKCAIDGKLKSIEIYGYIGYSDFELINALHRELTPDAIFPVVYLDSPGGRMIYAIEIGKILRERKATVITGSPYIDEKNIECSSACVFIAAGAVTRQLNHIGLHNGHSFDYKGPKKWTREELSSSAMSAFLNYLDTMGIDPEVKKIILSTPSDQITDFYFDPSEDRKKQKIVKLGFHMLRGAHPQKAKPPVSDEIAAEAARLRFINAIQYGSNSAIHDYVREILKSEPDEEPNYEEANKWLKIGADRNDPVSLHNLAFHLLNGKGEKADPERATQLFLRAARLGMAESQNNVGWHYYSGIGVKRSIADAVYWITRAADQGEPFAYGSLCEIYDAGDAFEPNNIEAYKWCYLAVEHEPDGHAKKGDERIFEKFKAKMSDEDRKKAEDLAKAWKPLKDAGGGMRDTDDG